MLVGRDDFGPIAASPVSEGERTREAVETAVSLSVVKTNFVMSADRKWGFVNGAGTNTFPTYVSSMTKHSRNLPSVFALSTLMLIFTCALVGASKLITSRSHATAKKG